MTSVIRAYFSEHITSNWEFVDLDPPPKPFKCITHPTAGFIGILNQAVTSQEKFRLYGLDSVQNKLQMDLKHDKQ